MDVNSGMLVHLDRIHRNHTRPVGCWPFVFVFRGHFQAGFQPEPSPLKLHSSLLTQGADVWNSWARVTRGPWIKLKRHIVFSCWQTCYHKSFLGTASKHCGLEAQMEANRNEPRWLLLSGRFHWILLDGARCGINAAMSAMKAENEHAIGFGLGYKWTTSVLKYSKHVQSLFLGFLFFH